MTTTPENGSYPKPFRKPQTTLRRWRITHTVQAEQLRQEQLWGVQDHTDLEWLPILGEEMGEVNKAINGLTHQDGTLEDLEAAAANLAEELTHVAAVAMTWLEAIERRKLSG